MLRIYWWMVSLHFHFQAQAQDLISFLFRERVRVHPNWNGVLITGLKTLQGSLTHYKQMHGNIPSILKPNMVVSSFRKYWPRTRVASWMMIERVLIGLSSTTPTTSMWICRGGLFLMISMIPGNGCLTDLSLPQMNTSLSMHPQKDD